MRTLTLQDMGLSLKTINFRNLFENPTKIPNTIGGISVKQYAQICVKGC
jgi:hypothetical protein